MITLVATPRSHFSRKVRLLMDHLEIDYTLEDIGNVADTGLKLFGGNPTLSVPTLIDGGRSIFDSDHIAAHLVRTYDQHDRFGVLTDDPDVLNTRAVMNSMMSSEVKLILAERTGLATEGHAFFEKAKDVIRDSLSWLEAHADLFSGDLSYAHFHLVSMWDHLVLFGPDRPPTPRIETIAAALGQQPTIARSAPPR
ncbi:MAG: glutathione S-transferase family protein [Pseudomonadota bacterium]